MKTIKPSPASQLRERFPLTGRRIGDWLTLADGNKVFLGLRVYHQRDPRHVGEIIAIKNSAFITVKWKNGWREIDIPITDLRKADEP